MQKRVNVIGAGLAGVEASFQLAKRNYDVHLYEMKPHKKSPAHKSDLFAELVCSNSLRSNSLENAVGVLKEEMRRLGSIVIKCADKHKVPAGGALAVDRTLFSECITNIIKNHPNITIHHKEVTKIPSEPTIIATGPLTSDAFSKEIQSLINEDYLYFYDAAAPIITKESIDMSKAYRKSRYDKGEADYINCPMNEKEFDNWYNELINAKTTKLKDFELKVFEGCMPFEEIAQRGKKTLLFGPMKPVGLEKHDGTRPYAVVQLRQDNKEGTLYNIVGFQTHLTFPEQKRIIRMIPGLENAEIVRYGVMHRNTFINSPKLLTQNYKLKQKENIYFAGQITGVEGYVESSASGILAGISLARKLNNLKEITFPKTTIIGSQANYISKSSIIDFQPMNANFGLLKPLHEKHPKKERKIRYAKRALNEIDKIIKELQEDDQKYFNLVK